MDVWKTKGKKNVLMKAWERCRSLGNTGRKSSATPSPLMRKSKSCHVFPSIQEEDNTKKKKDKCFLVAPEGCFSVYVGPQRQRFMIKTQTVNHPLFKLLLEDAELEYGFSPEGPLLLPCNVDLFYRVLAEIDDNGDGDMSPFVCGFGYSPCRHRSRNINKGYGSYKLLCSSPMTKLNSY
ncbi:auxin-responsive protein SAUR40-like [Hibiscus syriacus]|uniref:auxin-responsive protein SAUR40-like n=1 Tax=Hibiscus syriacus TaxID=106335 RepID=UPI001923C8CE|nr:auxin-responsive protein SAUR40-like [Hibiscus syriacus]